MGYVALHPPYTDPCGHFLPPNVRHFTDRLKAQAQQLGFDAVGVAPAVRPPGYSRYQSWLEHGYQAGMRYMKDREQCELIRKASSKVFEASSSSASCTVSDSRNPLHPEPARSLATLAEPTIMNCSGDGSKPSSNGSATSTPKREDEQFVIPPLSWNVNSPGSRDSDGSPRTPC